MKVKPSIAFKEFSGTASEVTAKKSKGVQILSTRAKLYSQKSNAQTNIRSKLTVVSRTFKTLSPEQLASWQKLAESCQGKSSLGEYANLSAANLFHRLNCNLLIAGRSIILSAPVIPEVPFVDFSYFKFSEESISIKGLNVNPSNTNLALAVKTTRGLSAGIANSWGKAVLINPAAVPTDGEVELISSYQSRMKLSPLNGQKHFVTMYWIDTATGFTGPRVNILGLVSDTPWKGEETEDPDRPRLTAKNVELDSCVEKFEVEQAPGSALFYADIIYKGSTLNEISYDLLKVPRRLITAWALLPARKLNDNNYRVALYCARTAVSGVNGHFDMDKRVTSGNDTYIEIFGTNPVYN